MRQFQIPLGKACQGRRAVVSWHERLVAVIHWNTQTVTQGCAGVYLCVFVYICTQTGEECKMGEFKGLNIDLMKR